MPRLACLLLIAALCAVSLPRTSAAAPGVPALVGPPDGARVTSFSPTLAWSLPAGATQVHLRVTPFKNDGPGIDLIFNAVDTFTIPGLPVCACLLPDMTYSWEVRASDAPHAAGLDDPSWSPPATRTFRTPTVSSGTIAPQQPAPGGTVATPNPTFQWIDTDPNVFYYELQVSKDAEFGAAGSPAPLYWVLLHGLHTSPRNSYMIPDAFPLETDSSYHWRVRPRVQGDGTAVAWSPVWTFTHRVECCTVTAWIERNLFVPEHASHRAHGRIVDGAGRPIVAAPMDAVFRQQFESARCNGGLSDAQGTASCAPSPFEPPPNFVLNVPVTVEVTFTYRNLRYSGITTFTPTRPWR